MTPTAAGAPDPDYACLLAVQNVLAMIATLSMNSRWCILVAALCLAVPARAWELEMAPMTAEDTFVTPSWTRVDFLTPFAQTPLVFVLPTSNGGDPATLRVRNVTTTGFEVIVAEASGTDGPHLEMQTAYLAVVPGTHTMPDGTRVAAILHTTSSFVSRSLGSTWDTVPLPAGFSGPPTVLATIQTARNETGNPPATPAIPFLEAAIDNVSTVSLQAALERAEATNGSVVTSEDLAILAIDANRTMSFVDGFLNNIDLQTVATGNTIRGWDNGCFTTSYSPSFSAAPVAVASMTTRNGNNGGWIRRCSESATNIGLTVDEDTETDSERNHTGESVGIIAASAAFHVKFAVDVSVQKSVQSLSDPINGTTNQKSIPSATMEYTIEVENRGALSPDTNTLTVVDNIPAELALCVTASCYAGGPIVLDTSASPVAPGINLLSVEYSNNGGASFGYSPSPDGDGFDTNIDAVRITLGGTFASVDTAGYPSFLLKLAARID